MNAVWQVPVAAAAQPQLPTCNGETIPRTGIPQLSRWQATISLTRRAQPPPWHRPPWHTLTQSREPGHGWPCNEWVTRSQARGLLPRPSSGPLSPRLRPSKTPHFVEPFPTDRQVGAQGSTARPGSGQSELLLREGDLNDLLRRPL